MLLLNWSFLNHWKKSFSLLFYYGYNAIHVTNRGIRSVIVSIAANPFILLIQKKDLLKICCAKDFQEPNFMMHQKKILPKIYKYRLTWLFIL